MTPASQLPDRDREIDRQLRSFNRRIQRLEDTQITAAELSLAFDRVYNEIDAVEDKIDVFRAEFDLFRLDTSRKFDEVNKKLDIIIRRTAVSTAMRYSNSD
jgi:predicted  nucleic acid-binding Zn-ribbon protein